MPFGVCTNIIGPSMRLELIPHAGQCTSQSTGAPTLQTTPGVACAPTTQCQEEFCLGKLGLHVCITKPGPQACPNDFPNMQAIGSGTTTPSCNCGCSVAPSCSLGGNLYAAQDCMGPATAAQTSGNCDTQTTNLSINPTIDAVTTPCDATHYNSSVDLIDPQTICCK